MEYKLQSKISTEKKVEKQMLKLGRTKNEFFKIYRLSSVQNRKNIFRPMTLFLVI